MANEEDRPFKAEYAKSGRAGCKQCHGTISKDTLRMAKMVQSAFYDGKQPNWYHFACFFKSSIIRSPNEVSGFSSLRWDDQEKIRKKISGAAGGGVDSTDGPAPSKSKSKRKTTRSDLTVEYAKSNRSTCKGCNSQIDKDEIRIAKMIAPEPDKVKFGGLIPSWHHVDCFLDNLSSLDAEGVAPEELSGFIKLDNDGKEEVKQKFITKVGKVKKGKKRKAADSDSPPPAAKKPKEGSEENKIMKEQSQLMWKIRDELRNSLTKLEMHQLLQANNQAVPKGESSILDRLADGMAFGALKPCSMCEGGQLTIRSHCYQCTGNMSSWSKCTFTSDDPERAKWVIPQELKEIPFLKKYKFKSRKRVFPKDTTPTPSLDVTDGPGPSQSSSGSVGAPTPKVEAPLKGFKVFIIGRLNQSKPVLTGQVESLGGRVVSSVSDTTTICISNEKEVEKMGKKMAEVRKCDVPVVSEDYLEEAKKGAALLKIPDSTISDWGAPRHSLPAAAEELGGKSFKSLGPSKVKMKVKGAAVVDPESELEDTHHVLEEGKTVWNAVLGLVDIIKGTNSYYKLQLLAGDKGVKNYHVFRSWGRVGTTIGGTKTEYFSGSLAAAKNSFTSLYAEKSGNRWGDSNFVKHPGKFYPLEIDYGQEEGGVVKLGASAGSSSKLVPQIQELIRMIFDVESMKKAMLEFEIDMKKMPLGKLSRRQMQNAYSVLTELQNEISGAKNPAKIMDASNRFYTLIPHDFGMTKPPPLDTEEMIKLKTQMVDNLLEIEVAYSLLKQDEGSGGGAKDPLDVHYQQLKTDMDVLPKDCEEFQHLVEYVRNTHGATHTQYELEVLEVFKVSKHGEEEKFKPFSKLHNRQLLWHGSRTTNFCGILSQGLRIAPPEAPVTGYMFGKGVYFADMASKSANYCRTSSVDNIGLMLLCEVALGDMYELTHSKYIEKLPAGKHSTKGLGRTAPDSAHTHTTKDGMVIPLGKGAPSSVTNTSLLYNEFIVYDVSQIKMHYLLKLDFKYKW